MNRLLFPLFLCTLVACEREAPPQVQRTELPLAVQVEHVRSRESIEIRLTSKLRQEDLHSIFGLVDLVRLNLNETEMTDEDVKQIAALPKLETLRFTSAKVTDQALAHLAKSRTLRHLILFDTPITDAGLRHLAALETLESLYLTGTRVTDAGLSALLERRPTLHVH